MKFVKRDVPVFVEFASTSGKLETLEGVVTYAAGDALVTAPTGERWPIARAGFESTYEPVAPLAAGQTGRYVKKPVAVEACRLDATRSIELAARRGTLTGHPGDWLVTGTDGQQWIVEDAIFRTTYRPLGGDSS